MSGFQQQLLDPNIRMPCNGLLLDPIILYASCHDISPSLHLSVRAESCLICGVVVIKVTWCCRRHYSIPQSLSTTVSSTSKNEALKVLFQSSRLGLPKDTFVKSNKKPKILTGTERLFFSPTCREVEIVWQKSRKRDQNVDQTNSGERCCSRRGDERGSGKKSHLMLPFSRRPYADTHT